MVKQKVDKVPAQEEESTVLEFLRKQNRPYAANDLVAQLPGKVGKSSIAGTINTLLKAGEIIAKPYGGKQIYLIKQESSDVATPQQMETLDLEIQSNTQQMNELQQKSRQLSEQLSRLTSSLTDEDLETKLTTLTAENEKRLQRLEVLRDGGNLISEKELKKINKDYETNRKIWKDRKNKCTEIFGMILENSTAKKKDLLEEIGIATDEDAGVKTT